MCASMLMPRIMRLAIVRIPPPTLGAQTEASQAVEPLVYAPVVRSPVSRTHAIRREIT